MGQAPVQVLHVSILPHPRHHFASLDVGNSPGGQGRTRVSCSKMTCAPSVVARISRWHALRADDAAIHQPLHEIHIFGIEGPAEAALQDLDGVVGRAGLLCLEGVLAMSQQRHVSGSGRGGRFALHPL